MSSDPQYLSKLQDYYARHRVLPSYSEIGALVGMRSKASVAGMVQRLKDMGFLEGAPRQRLRPGQRFFERAHAESVQAGLPSPAADIGRDDLTIDDYLIRHPSRTVLIRVKGDSMAGAGIMSDDLAVVEKGRTAKLGDLVVAIVENEFTLKRLDKERGQFVLRPENKAYPVIRPKGKLEMFGVVVGMVRRYK
jgi:SOS-response transcriptional repressor LexA